MNPIIKKLIEANIEYIENNDFNTVYSRAMSVNHKINIGEITDIFYASGIDPLASMTEVPPLFLDGSKLTALVVPENINEIRKSGFAYSSLEHVELHDKCELKESAFFSSIIMSIKIPYIMNEVPDECFSGCTLLSNVDLNAVEQIGEEAFYMCKNLQTLFIPDDINFIADSAFNSCPVILQFHNDNEYAIEYCQRTGMEYKFV